MKLKQAMGLLLCAAIASIWNLDAQVTIGSSEEPNEGALLDLKMKNDGMSTKGIELPRVQLTALTTTNTDMKVTVNGATGATWDKTEHIGLTVYNTARIETMENRVCPGIHVWDGDEWQPIVTYPAIGEQKTLQSVANRNFEYLDNTSPANAWPAGKTVADYPLGYIGTFTDNRPNDAAQTYNYTRFYVGYRTRTVTYNIERNYNCDPTTTPNWVIVDTETENLRTFEDGVWMTENLRAIKMPDGTDITQSVAQNFTTPYYHYPNLQAANKQYGVLYNWPAAINMGTGPGQTPDPGGVEQGASANDDVRIQGICPAGWRLPSEQAWIDLENGIILKTATFSSTANISTIYKVSYDFAIGWLGSTHGTAMKATGSYINGYTSGGSSKTAAAGGFEIFLAGYAVGGIADSYGKYAFFWSSSSSSSNSLAWSRRLNYGYTQAYRTQDTYSILCSVRCMKETD